MKINYYTSHTFKEGYLGITVSPENKAGSWKQNKQRRKPKWGQPSVETSMQSLTRSVSTHGVIDNAHAIVRNLKIWSVGTCILSSIYINGPYFSI